MTSRSMSPRRAIAWELWRGHRWGWGAIAIYLLVMAGIKAWAFAFGHTLTVNDDETFGLFVMFPMSATILYAITVFTFGLTGDLAARESLFPRRLLRLPVTTRSLARWLMLFGAVVMVFLWTATRSLLILPPNVTIPIVWPAVLGVAILGWAQTATWMPYGLRGVRVIVTVLWLVVIDAIVILAIALQAPEWVMVSMLAPQIPIAWRLAEGAVARARRGDVPDWGRSAVSPVTGVARWKPFPSPAAAQLWYEWRHHGWNFPALVAIVVPVELLLFFTSAGAPGLVFLILAGVLITPPFLARAAGATVRRTTAGSDSHGLPPFLATRPLTSAALVSAKTKVTVASTALAWLFVAITTPIAMTLSGTWALLIDRITATAAAIGGPRTLAIGVVLGAVLLLSTWRQLVQSLYVGLTGREWLVKANVFGALFLVFLLVPFLKWTWEHKRVVAWIWDAIPAILAVLVTLKTIAALAVYRALARRRVLTERALVTSAALWSAGVFALYGTAVWFWDTTILPHYVMGMMAILIVPLARVSLAPLALDWNRHR
jgi:hypothetical protein